MGKEKEEIIAQVNKTPQPESNEVELTSVITQTETAFKLPDGNIVSLNELLVWMANKLHDISRKL